MWVLNVICGSCEIDREKAARECVHDTLGSFLDGLMVVVAAVVLVVTAVAVVVVAV